MHAGQAPLLEFWRGFGLQGLRAGSMRIVCRGDGVYFCSEPMAATVALPKAILLRERLKVQETCQRGTAEES
jgi:hypothetical protein